MSDEATIHDVVKQQRVLIDNNIVNIGAINVEINKLVTKYEENLTKIDEILKTISDRDETRINFEFFISNLVQDFKTIYYEKTKTIDDALQVCQDAINVTNILEKSTSSNLSELTKRVTTCESDVILEQTCLKQLSTDLQKLVNKVFLESAKITTNSCSLAHLNEKLCDITNNLTNLFKTITALNVNLKKLNSDSLNERVDKIEKTLISMKSDDMQKDLDNTTLCATNLELLVANTTLLE